ncbi:NAD-dependent protein lipoamidase sirtuin-4 [Irineochytrium annulatum]|nr:NAD-dependent protein lipoamidase sirtuin-4 [Irineochytrium annulatum]
MEENTPRHSYEDTPPLSTYHAVSEATLAEDVPTSPSTKPKKRVHEYFLLQTIGKGTFGKVKLAEHYLTKERYAVKSILKSNVKTMKQMNSVQREIRLMKLLYHPHIIEVKETLEDLKQIFLVMEYASGGDLYDYIKRNKPLSEDTCRHFFRQIISAVDYCHQNSVIHRDLKPENCLIDEHGNIKIIDFGFGNTFHRDRTLDTYCGSPYYAAPEMIRGTPYVGPEVDIGALPFDHSDQPAMYSLILKGAYSPLIGVSQDVKNLIARILTVDPIRRAKMQEIMRHVWTNLKYSHTPEGFNNQRPAVVHNPSTPAIRELVTYGIAEVEARKMLSYDCGLHPIKSLYFLVDDFQKRVHAATSSGAHLDSSGNLASLETGSHRFMSAPEEDDFDDDRGLGLSDEEFGDADGDAHRDDTLVRRHRRSDAVAPRHAGADAMTSSESLGEASANAVEGSQARYIAGKNMSEEDVTYRRKGVYVSKDSEDSLIDHAAGSTTARRPAPTEFSAVASVEETAQKRSKLPTNKILQFLRRESNEFDERVAIVMSKAHLRRLTTAAAIDRAIFSPSTLSDRNVHAVADVHRLITESRHLLVLTGAGVSTASGIPDYRGPNGIYSRKDFKPIQFQEFIGSPSNRRRYWARSFLGWPRISSARPNPTHKSLSALSSAGRVAGGLITQNVDGLHGGPERGVLELHGRLRDVQCLGCGRVEPRQNFQEMLADLNPEARRWAERNPGKEDGDVASSLNERSVNPDGDVDVTWDYSSFRYPDCMACGGMYKPSVVFFGENIPPQVRDQSLRMVDEADAMLIIGSSLHVYSAYRLLKKAAERGIRVGALSLGGLRGSELLTFHHEVFAETVLPEVVATLGGERKHNHG